MSSPVRFRPEEQHLHPQNSGGQVMKNPSGAGELREPHEVQEMEFRERGADGDEVGLTECGEDAALVFCGEIPDHGEKPPVRREGDGAALEPARFEPQKEVARNDRFVIQGAPVEFRNSPGKFRQVGPELPQPGVGKESRFQHPFDAVQLRIPGEVPDQNGKKVGILPKRRFRIDQTPVTLPRRVDVPALQRDPHPARFEQEKMTDRPQFRQLHRPQIAGGERPFRQRRGSVEALFEIRDRRRVPPGKLFVCVLEFFSGAVRQDIVPPQGLSPDGQFRWQTFADPVRLLPESAVNFARTCVKLRQRGGGHGAVEVPLQSGFAFRNAAAFPQGETEEDEVEDEGDSPQRQSPFSEELPELFPFPRTEGLRKQEITRKQQNTPREKEKDPLLRSERNRGRNEEGGITPSAVETDVDAENRQRRAAAEKSRHESEECRNQP